MRHHLTHDQVHDVVGTIDDLRAAEIIGTGASLEELVEARRWAEGNKRTLSDDMPVRPSIVSRICDILRSEDTDWYDRPDIQH